MRTFSQRMWNAIKFIESGRDHYRQLDEAFENFDGDAMAAALYKMTESREVLRRNITRYVVPIEQMSPDIQRLANLSMKDIRRAALQQRTEAYQASEYFRDKPVPQR